MGTTIGLLATGAMGMLGWFFAWLEARAAHARRAELEAALAGEGAAKAIAIAAEARAAGAIAQLDAAKSRAEGLQAQLEALRSGPSGQP